jgi:hypothetical protein
MTGPLDPDVATACADADPRLTYQDDELTCSHCWSAIIGREAGARHNLAYQNDRQQLTRHGKSAECDLCQDTWLPYIRRQYLRLAVDFDRHAELCQCPQCGSLYEVFPEDLTSPARLTVEQSRQRYPGAL